MKIEQGKVVSFQYKSSDEQDNEIENTWDDEPMEYLIGSRGIMPALEDALQGKQQGDVFELSVPPHKAYGVRRDDATQRVPIKHLINPPRKLKPGQTVRLSTDKGPREVTVLKAGRYNVDVDLNHPRSGQTIDFEVEVVGVRNATGSELAHGHAHGPGGHHHN